ncbi:hypothetical protein ACFLU5_09960 [Bacteroidota bacterium]
MSGRLIILSGLSCVGKSPLDKALAKFYPEIKSNLQPMVLYNDRQPRPGERDGIDYHFRTRKQIEDLKPEEQYVKLEVRGDLQALDLMELSSQLSSGDVFFEGNPFVGSMLLSHNNLEKVDKLTIFMSPISIEEIQFLQKAGSDISLPDLATDVMRRKLLRRTKKQKTELSLKDLENIEKRAGSAYIELKMAHKFEYVIPNHDGEDSENWDAFFYPLGDARKSLIAFVDLYYGRQSGHVEKWEEGILI